MREINWFSDKWPRHAREYCLFWRHAKIMRNNIHAVRQITFKTGRCVRTRVSKSEKSYGSDHRKNLSPFRGRFAWLTERVPRIENRARIGEGEICVQHGDALAPRRRSALRFQARNFFRGENRMASPTAALWSELIRALKDSGIRQSQIASAVGASPSTISRWVHDEVNEPRASRVLTLVALARRRGLQIPSAEQFLA